MKCFDDFVNEVTDLKLQIISVTESWLPPSFPSSLIAIPGYSLHRCDRLSRGGGVCCYVRKGIKNQIINLNDGRTHLLEQLWVRICINNKSYAVGTIYRPPHVSAAFINELERILSMLVVEYDGIIILGDLNVNLLSDSTLGASLKSLFDSFNLVQVINQPTRVTANSESLIDVICLSNDIGFSYATTHDMSHMTDHCLVSCRLDVSSENSQPQYATFRNLKNINTEEFAFDASSINWTNVVNYDNINDKLTYVNSAIAYLFDMHAPVCTVRINTKKPAWLTYTLRCMIKLREKAFKRYVKTKKSSDWKCYQDIRNYVTQAISNERKAYFQHQVDIRSNSPGRLWKFFDRANIHARSKNEMDLENADPDLLNRFFANSAPKTTINMKTINEFRNSCHPRITEKLTFCLVSPDDVVRSISKLKSNAVGIDNISSRMLKLVLPFCVDTFTHLINYCLETSTFPEVWKKSIIVPLPKTSTACRFEDLRPISILPALSKVLESFIHLQLLEHIEEFDVLPNTQSGFRSGFSTTTALSKVLNDVISNMDNSKVTVMALLDFSKAFDVIDHDLLIAKLVHYGCGESALKLLINYLKGRSQCVKLNSTLSEYLQITRGVPQGSVLGPLLFVIFTADLPKVLPEGINSHEYVDDTQLNISGEPSSINEIVRDVNVCLELVLRWSSSNGLFLNPSKTVCLCVGSSRCRAVANNVKCTDILLDNNVINFNEKTKNLGVIWDCGLTFENHVNKICSMGYFKLKALYRYKHLLPSEVKWNLIQSLVLCHVDYCSAVYYGCLTGYLKNKLQVLQNACLRYAYYVDRWDHVTPTYNSQQILKIEARCELQFALLLYSVYKSGRPGYLHEFINQRSSCHELNLRNNGALSVPTHRTVKFEGSFQYRTAHTFNKFASHYLNASSKLSFKARIKELLMAKQIQGSL